MYCPNCGQKNEEQARFCEACGTPLQEQKPQGPVCPRCGAAIEEAGAMFCPECGMRLNGNQPGPAEATQPIQQVQKPVRPTQPERKARPVQPEQNVQPERKVQPEQPRKKSAPAQPEEQTRLETEFRPFVEQPDERKTGKKKKKRNLPWYCRWCWESWRPCWQWQLWDWKSGICSCQRKRMITLYPIFLS